MKRREGTRDHPSKGEGRRSQAVTPSLTTGLVAEAKSSGLSPKAIGGELRRVDLGACCRGTFSNCDFLPEVGRVCS